MGFEMKASVKLEKNYSQGWIYKEKKEYILYKMARINFTMKLIITSKSYNNVKLCKCDVIIIGVEYLYQNLSLTI